MAVKKIITTSNPILRQKSKPVKKIDKKIKELVIDLTDTAKAAKEPRGVGLSAVQIGKLARVFVIKLDKEFIPLINPEITWQSKKLFSQVLEKEKQFLEGCLSVPGYYGFIDRPSVVELKWQDLAGKTHQEKFKDKQSAYVQHELDHLDGILFVERILEQKGKLYKLEKDSQGEETLVERELT